MLQVLETLKSPGDGAGGREEETENPEDVEEVKKGKRANEETCTQIQENTCTTIL